MMPPCVAFTADVEWSLNSSHQQAVWWGQELRSALLLRMAAVKLHLNLTVVT